MQKNPVCYWELASNDAERSIEFLKNVFDWDVVFEERLGLYDIPAGDCPNGFSGGGVFTLRKAKLPFLTIYVRVEDVDSKAGEVARLGGHVIEPPHQIPGGARICLFNEPSGVTFAMVQPAPSG